MAVEWFLATWARNSILIPTFSPNPEFIEGSREKEDIPLAPCGRGMG
jgi:hypothetical protein